MLQRRVALLGAVLSVAAVVASARGSSGAFLAPRPRPSRRNDADAGIRSSNDDGGVFFDDFGEGFPDSNNGGNGLSSLQSRMGQVKAEEAAYDSKIARNWRRGNWGVRGFALDGTSYATSSSSSAPVRVSAVAAPTSSASIDISLPPDRALPQEHIVAVGRTDGSIFVVKLGERYLTSFVAAPKLVVERDDQSGGDEMSVRVQNEWMDSNELKDQLHGDRPKTMESGMGDEWDGTGNAVDSEEVMQEETPFEIAYQFLASERGEAINKLAFHDAVEGSGGIICASFLGAGEISTWKLPSSGDEYQVPVQTALLTGVHRDEIVSLETMIVNDRNMLFSASREGKFALWDLDRNGELMQSWQCTDVEYGRPVSLTCADVYNPSRDDDGYGFGGEDDGQQDVIFLGASNGYVMGYVVEELLSLAASGDPNDEPECPVPNLRFRAHGTDTGVGESVTAIKCGGDGTIPTGRGSMGRNPRMSSSILLTGGEDGSIKQWEILSQNSPSSPAGIRMEHWPRLSTQRMKRRAHLFTPPHVGPVSCISRQGSDPSKFLTSGADGSVCVWSASSGEELFRMDGFEGLSSLACLGRELLVTDGMNQYVCVHDFGIEEDAASEGYDLEW